MADNEALRLSARVVVPRDELVLRATRSSGPGGQHVNTSSTRVELVWDVAKSPSLDEESRMLLLRRLASRLDSAGQLRLVSQEERSQLRNREAVIERFVDMVGQALIIPKKRRPTRPTAGSNRARLKAKRHRAERKRERRPPEDE